MSEPALVRTAAALLIGNELLSGKVQEANLGELARTLRTLGVELRRVFVVPDEVEVIAEDVRALSSSHDVVFTSGGVGPTHDDVTIEAVSVAFGVKPVMDPTMESLLRGAYGDKCSDAHLRMALVPEGAELMTTPDILWPTVMMKNVWVLPGVPEIFRMKLAVVRERIRGPEPFSTRAAYTNLDEATLKPLLDQVVSEHPEVDVGSYPKWFDSEYKTKVTVDGRSITHVEAAFSALLALLPPGEPQRVQ